MKTPTILTALALASVATTHAAIISVNLTDGGPSNGDAVAGETAGAVTAPYWNTLNGLTGAAQNNVDSASLFDDSGNASGVGFDQSATVGGFYSSPFATGFSGSIADQTMTNFADTSGSYTITLTGLHAGVGMLYDVYLYSARGYSNTGVTRFEIDGSSQFIVNEDTTGDYSETGWATEALAESNPNSGNYVRFRNVSLDTLAIGITGSTDDANGGDLGAVNGFQIVQVPEPSSTAILGLAGFGVLARRRR